MNNIREITRIEKILKDSTIELVDTDIATIKSQTGVMPLGLSLATDYHVIPPDGDGKEVEHTEGYAEPD